MRLLRVRYHARHQLPLRLSLEFAGLLSMFSSYGTRESTVVLDDSKELKSCVW